jgi:endonuclease YncB( thermonuclease family)
LRFLMLGVSVVATVAGVGLSTAKPRDDRAQSIGGRVTGVVDGDTISVRTLDPRPIVRTVELIGIDAPEKRPGRVECGGRQATSNILQLTFTAPLDTDGDHFFDTSGGVGRLVTLTTDPTGEPFHGRGALLAYAKTAGGKQLQLDQLTRGWAKVHAGRRRFHRYRLFRRAQADAIVARHGVWSKCGGNFHLSSPP